MKNVLKILMALAVISLTACSDDNDRDFVRLSGSSFTFGGDGYDEYTVTVEASGKWEAIYENPSWFTVEQTDENTLVITATPSKSNQEKKGRITVVSGTAEEPIDLTQLGTNVLYNTIETNSVDHRLSPGGNYIAGVEVKLSENVYTYTPYRIKTKTGERENLPALNMDVSAGAIADDGTLMLFPQQSLTSVYFTPSNELKEVALPAGYNYAKVCGVSGDGKIWVGFAQSNKLYSPVKWVNGVPEILSAPMVDPAGVDVYTGTMARGCSGDGSVIYGSLWDGHVGVYWKDGGSWQWVGGTEAHNIQRNGVEVLLDRPIIMHDLSKNSNNGRYIAASYQGYNIVNGQAEVYYYPCYIDTETNKLTILRDLPGGAFVAYGQTVSDDGAFVYTIMQGTSFSGYVYDIKSGTTYTNEEFLNKEYGYRVRYDNGYIREFSKGGSSLLGGTYVLEGTNMTYWYMTTLTE